MPPIPFLARKFLKQLRGCDKMNPSDRRLISARLAEIDEILEPVRGVAEKSSLSYYGSLIHERQYLLRQLNRVSPLKKK